jgi:hypothetical protein
MMDGTYKKIETIAVGDGVAGPFNELNLVCGIHQSRLGTTPLYKINDDHYTTNIHPYISPDKRFYSGNSAELMSLYGNSYYVITGDTQSDYWKLWGLNESRIQPLASGKVIQSFRDTSKTITSIQQVAFPESTQLYNLVVNGSHTYCVDGYAVTGWPREDDFSYDMWSPCMYLPESVQPAELPARTQQP